MNQELERSQWKRIKFGDVVRNVNESVKDPANEGIDRVIAMEHLNPGELQIRAWGNIADGTTFTRRVRPGQTLFGKRRAYQRKAAYAEFDGICSGDILVFQAIESMLLPKLLPFIVQSEGFYANAIGTSAGSLSPRTNWKDLSAYEFDLPPLDQQQRIASILWAIERHLSVLHQQFPVLVADEAVSGSLRHSLFQSTFATTDDAKKIRLADVVRLRSGSFLPKVKMASDGKVPVYGGNGIAGWHDEATNSEDVVLIGRVGEYCGVVHMVTGPSWVTDNALVASAPSGSFSNAFLAASLRFASLNQFASKTAQPLVSAGRLANVLLPNVSLKLQEGYLDAAEQISKAHEALIHEREALAALKNSILRSLEDGRKA